MQHFITAPENIQGNRIVINGRDVKHIRSVLRMQPGEEISVSNGIDDREYRCEIESISEDEVLSRLMFIKEEGVELPVRITLFQGLPKADKMDLIVQKAVELGAYRIVPVVTARSIVKLDEKKAASRTERWQGISEAAAKQSKRSVIPQVEKPLSMKEAVKSAAGMHLSAIPYELAKGMDSCDSFIRDLCALAREQGAGHDGRAAECGIFIGPEGGFTEEEVALAQENNVRPVSLGRRILRTETAGMAFLSILMFHLEDRDESVECALQEKTE